VKESKESLLEESDPMWVDLRHMFIADVSIKLNNLLTTFREQNKAAKVLSLHHRPTLFIPFSPPFLLKE
jgi:hypothetical protein